MERASHFKNNQGEDTFCIFDVYIKYSYFQQLQLPPFVNVAAWPEETNLLSLALKIFCNLALPYLKNNMA